MKNDDDLKIVKEVAEDEFERFVDCMDLDFDTSEMDVEDLTQFTKHKSKLINAICRGSLVINENGEAVYTSSNPKSTYKDAITFHERTGASLMATDGKKKNHEAAKTYAAMGEMCKIHPNVFTKLHGIDIKICEVIFALLMD